MAKDANILDWDATIENDGNGVDFLDQEGKFFFTVTKMDKGVFNGSAKIPQCNKAILTLDVETPDGIKVCKTDLILYGTLEWKLSSFFRSIGQKQKGEKLTMNWNAVVGSRGYAEFKYQNGSDKFFDVNFKETPANAPQQAKKTTILGVEVGNEQNPFTDNFTDQDLPF